MIARSKPLRVLPCVDSTVFVPSIAVLRSTVGVDLLSVAPASTLIYRALSDEPDAVVIATEDFGSVAGRNDSDLIEVFSSTPTSFGQTEDAYAASDTADGIATDEYEDRGVAGECGKDELPVRSGKEIGAHWTAGVDGGKGLAPD